MQVPGPLHNHPYSSKSDDLYGIKEASAVSLLEKPLQNTANFVMFHQ